MTGYGSLKMIDAVKVEVPAAGEPAPMPMFAGGVTTAAVGAGVMSDPDGGRLVLQEGGAI